MQYKPVVYAIITYWRFIVNAGGSIIKAKEKEGTRWQRN